MLGAIIGDIVGSRFEWNNHRSKDFEFLTYKCFPTDDSIMSLAIAQAILVSKKDYSDLSKNAIECMQNVGRNYPNCGYGGSFYGWIFSDDPKPYNSYGNGAAMRVSAAGFAANSIEEAKKLSRLVTEVSHNHPEGIKGAEATVVAIFMAKTGSNIFEIRDYIDKNYYPMNFTLDEIRDTYHFNETCQETVPQNVLKHIEKIAKAYDKYESDGDIAKVVTIKDIAKNDYSLSIPLYIQTSSEEKEDDRTVQECYRR